MNKLKIKQIQIKDLIPYTNNARMHSDGQISQIADSIRKFGFNNPILCDGGNGVIAGHGRLLAAKKLGIETVPVVELSHLTESQKRAYILADNRLSDLSEFDSLVLEKEIEFLDVLPPGIDEDFLSEIGIDLDDSDLDFSLEPKSKSLNPKSGNTIKIAIFCEQIDLIESAIIETGMKNRGEALKIICEEFLEKRQFNIEV